MKLTNRILKIIKNSGLTPSEFADKIQVQRSAISHITSGRNKPSLDFLLKVKESYPEIDTDWLLFGIEKEESLPSDLEKIPTNKSHLFAKEKPQMIAEENSNQENQLFPRSNSTNDSRENQKSNRKKIVRVLLFFDDGSFEDFEN